MRCDASPKSLHGEQDEERHHQTEETHGLGQCESQDGIREELLLQGGVPVEESTEVRMSQYGSDDISDKSSLWL